MSETNVRRPTENGTLLLECQGVDYSKIRKAIRGLDQVMPNCQHYQIIWFWLLLHSILCLIVFSLQSDFFSPVQSWCAENCCHTVSCLYITHPARQRTNYPSILIITSLGRKLVWVFLGSFSTTQLVICGHMERVIQQKWLC